MSDAKDDKPKAEAPKETAAKPQAAAADFKATHVSAQWKTDSPLVSCRFDPTGTYVFAGGQDSVIYRFEVATGKRTKIAGHESWVRDFAFMRDGLTLIACDYAGRLIWWPCAQEKPAATRTVEAHAGWVRCVNISPDGKLLATGGNDNLVKVWEADTGKPVRSLESHDSHVYSTMFHDDGRHVLSGDLMGHVHVWEIETGKLARSFDASEMQKHDPTFRAHYGGVRSLALSPDGKHLACAGLHKCTNAFAGVNEPLVMRFEYESGKKVTSHEHNVRALAWRALFHPTDGFLLSATGGGAGGYLAFWQDGVKPAHALKLPNIAREMDLHPDGLTVATAHFDSHLRLSRMAKKA